MRMKYKRVLAAVTAAVMAWNLCNFAPALAGSVKEYVVDDVEDLPSEILYQTVGYGTEKRELDLPGKLSILAREADPGEDRELETVPTASTASPSEADLPVATPSGADDAGNHAGDDGGDEGSIWREVRVNWTVNEALSEGPEYDGETPGTYLFEAEFQSGRYKLGEGVLPSIEVEVLPREKTGITSWSYVDPEGYLVKTEAGYELALPGASEENPVRAEDITALLPLEITSVIGGGQTATGSNADSEETITLAGWSCEAYPEEGAYEGSYVFAAKLPEGDALAEGAEALEVTVILGGGSMLVTGRIPYIDENGEQQVYEGEYTRVVNSTGSATWAGGWYYVDSDVTISGRITVNNIGTSNPVRLVLKDGATLKALSGIEVGSYSLTVVPSPHILYIYAQSDGDGMGTLIATGQDGNPGIGSNASVAGIGGCGTIMICGGNVQADGGELSAGIGGKYAARGAQMMITGGKVTAKGGESGPGIGIGPNSTGASISVTIAGGTVNAEGSGTGAGIAGSLFTVKQNNTEGDAIIYAAGGTGGNALTYTGNESDWTGIIFQDNSGQVYGSQTLTEDFIVEHGQTLTIPAGKTLTVAEGVTLTNNGTITNNGTLDPKGTLANNGKINGGGTLKGVKYLDSEGNVKTADCKIMTDSITSMTGWYYVGSDVTVDVDRAEYESYLSARGEANLILGDNATLTAKQGIRVSEGHTLNIYAQSTGDSMGKLEAVLSATSTGVSLAGIGGHPVLGGTGKIVIRGGSIFAKGYMDGAGIGARLSSNSAGTIIISGGIVNAEGGFNGAGIGGNDRGTVTISGGIVNATGGVHGAGIGGGPYETDCKVTISGGTVHASGGVVVSSGIGGGYMQAGSPQPLSTGESGNAIIYATIGNKSDSANWSGIVFEGDSGQVYGNPAMTQDVSVTGNQTLAIPESAKLTMESGTVMTIDSTDRLSGDGSIDGDGEFYVNYPSAAMIQVPQLTYTGEALETSGIRLMDSITVMGKEFSFTGDISQWERSFSKGGSAVTEIRDAGEYTVTFASGGSSVSRVFTVAASGLEGTVKTYLKGDESQVVRTEFTYGDTIGVKVAFSGQDAASASRSRTAYPEITEKQGAVYAVIDGVETQLTEPQTAAVGEELDFEVNTIEAGLKAGTYILIARYMTGDSNIEDVALYSDLITVQPCPHDDRKDGICMKCGNYETPGLADGVYQIGNTGQLYWFAALVSGDDENGRAEGITAADRGANAILTADIPDCEKMIGSESAPYAGTFNGNGYTVTVNLNASGNHAALFSAIQDATIQNLYTAGTIMTGYQFAGGVAGKVMDGESRIERCISSVEIRSTRNGDGTHGGIVGVGDSNGTMLLEDCAFVGKLTGTSTTNCGGIVGWVGERNNSSIKNCWTAAEFQLKSGETGSANIARNADDIIKNCYYQTGLYGTQGIQKTAEEFASGEVAWLLQKGRDTQESQVWGQKLEGDTADRFPVLSAEAEEQVVQLTIVISGEGGAAETNVYYLNAGLSFEHYPASGQAKEYSFYEDETFQKPINKDMKTYISDTIIYARLNLDPAARVVPEGGNATEYYSLAEAVKNATDDTRTAITLLKNISGEDITIESGQNIILDLAGYTLRGTGTGSVVTVKGSLKLTDSSEGTGAITGGTGTEMNSYKRGGGMYVTGGGMLTMEGGCIDGNKADRGAGIYIDSNGSVVMDGGIIRNGQPSETSSYGGGVHCGGSFTMNGGSITQNKKDGYNTFDGGGVYVDHSGIFTMTGGVISQNDADFGGGVCVDGLLRMSGGTILENRASFFLFGDGVYFRGGTIELSGVPRITGNKDSNLYISTGAASVRLSDGLQEGADIGISVAIPGDAPDSYIAQITETEHNTTYYQTSAGYFHSDNPEYEVRADEERRALVLAKPLPDSVSVTVFWSAMDFTYSDGVWNPDTHTYGAGWQPTDGLGTWIRVKNQGTGSVEVSYSFVADENLAGRLEGLTGSFTDSSGQEVSLPQTLAAGTTGQVYLNLTSGRPKEFFRGAALGTVTVTIGGDTGG